VRGIGGRLGVLCAALLLVSGGNADASISFFWNSGTLSITSDGSDSIVVTCLDGFVRVNDAEPGQAIACDAVLYVTANGGPGDNVIDLRGVTATAFTSLHSTSVYAGDGADTLWGSSVANGLNGGPGNDSINGGAGTDSVFGDAGGDAIDGAGEDDYLDGSADNDSIAGGAGDDRFVTNPGSDVFWGGDGEDTADYSRATENVNVNLDGLANDGLENGEWDNIQLDVENVLGSPYLDTLNGSDSPNYLYGGQSLVLWSAADVIHGHGGDDTLELLAGWANGNDGAAGTEPVSGRSARTAGTAMTRSITPMRSAPYQ